MHVYIYIYNIYTCTHIYIIYIYIYKVILVPMAQDALVAKRRGLALYTAIHS